MKLTRVFLVAACAVHLLAPGSAHAMLYAVHFFAGGGGGYSLVDEVTGVGGPVTSFSYAVGGSAEDAAGNVILSEVWQPQDILLSLDQTTLAITEGAPVVPSINARALAYDIAGDRLFAVGDADPSNLYDIDINTGAASIIGSIGFGRVMGLAYGGNPGVLYGWDWDGGLLTIDTVTGAGASIAGSGFGIEAQGLTYAPDGLIYGARRQLYSFDPTTGIPTAIGPGGLPGDIRGLGIASWEVVDTIIPEPTTVALLALAGLGLLRRRRRCAA